MHNNPRWLEVHEELKTVLQLPVKVFFITHLVYVYTTLVCCRRTMIYFIVNIISSYRHALMHVTYWCKTSTYMHTHSNTLFRSEALLRLRWISEALAGIPKCTLSYANCPISFLFYEHYICELFSVHRHIRILFDITVTQYFSVHVLAQTPMRIVAALIDIGRWRCLFM